MPTLHITAHLLRHTSRAIIKPVKPLTLALKMSSSSTTTTPSRAPIFSSNTDPSIATSQLDSLLLNPGIAEGKWRLMESGKGLERGFKFKTFGKTWEFMNLIAAECKVVKHHPEWSNVYNTTFIRWTTHSPAGLSGKDIQMARFCDEKAAVCGEIVGVQKEGERESGKESKEGAGDWKGEGGGGKDGKGRELMDRVVIEGGNCCVPKKKGVVSEGNGL